jgi:hypothetical protein
MTRLRFVTTGTVVVVALAFAGCYYPPPYTPVVVSSGPASFDASWQAARGAAYDEGVRVTSEDRATGTIRGDQGPYHVMISVAPQANGSVRVEFSVTGPPSEGAGLQDRLTRAYNKRMGR